VIDEIEGQHMNDEIIPNNDLTSQPSTHRLLDDFGHKLDRCFKFIKIDAGHTLYGVLGGWVTQMAAVHSAVTGVELLSRLGLTYQVLVH
jgi:hypothetical protein